MRPSIRSLAVLVACAAVVAGAAAAARPPKTEKSAAGKAAGKAGPQEKEGRAFLDGVTGLLWPVSTAAGQADWIAATDVTPEHTGQRTGADKVLAALTGAKPIIDKTKGFLSSESALDDVTARQLRKLLLGAAESPGSIPQVVARRVEMEARQ